MITNHHFDHHIVEFIFAGDTELDHSVSFVLSLQYHDNAVKKVFLSICRSWGRVWVFMKLSGQVDARIVRVG